LAVLHLDGNNFGAEVLQYTGTVLVDFFASWCGPCKMLAPILEEFEAKNEGKYKIAKVNTEADSALAHRMGISVVPTLLFFKNGTVAFRSEGFIPIEDLTKLAEKYLT
jgi:thioredoxin 1